MTETYLGGSCLIPLTLPFTEMSCLGLPGPVFSQFQNFPWSLLSTRLFWLQEPASFWVRKLLRMTLVLPSRP